MLLNTNDCLNLSKIKKKEVRVVKYLLKKTVVQNPGRQAFSLVNNTCEFQTSPGFNCQSFLYQKRQRPTIGHLTVTGEELSFA